MQKMNQSRSRRWDKKQLAHMTREQMLVRHLESFPNGKSCSTMELTDLACGEFAFSGDV